MFNPNTYINLVTDQNHSMIKIDDKFEKKWRISIHTHMES